MSMSMLIAAAAAAGLVLLSGPFFIPELHKLKFGQSIREEGPKSHQAKSGTPTMGGIMIILAILIATCFAAHLSTKIILALFVMLGHFVIGFVDNDHVIYRNGEVVYADSQILFVSGRLSLIGGVH